MAQEKNAKLEALVEKYDVYDTERLIKMYKSMDLCDRRSAIRYILHQRGVV